MILRSLSKYRDTGLLLLRILSIVQPVVVRIERTTGTKAVILLASQHDSTTIDTFGQHLGAVPKLDPGTFKLGD